MHKINVENLCESRGGERRLALFIAVIAKIENAHFPRREHGCSSI